MNPPLTMTATMSLGMKVTRLFHTFISFAAQIPARGAAAQLPQVHYGLPLDLS